MPALKCKKCGKISKVLIKFSWKSPIKGIKIIKTGL